MTHYHPVYSGHSGHSGHIGRAIVSTAPRPYAVVFSCQSGEHKLACSNFPDNEDIRLRISITNRDKLDPRRLQDDVFGLGIWEYAVCHPEFSGTEERTMVFANNIEFNIPFVGEIADPILTPIYFTPEKLVLEGLIQAESLGEIPAPEEYRWYEYEVWGERTSQLLDSGAFTRTPRDRQKKRTIHYHRTPTWI